MRPQVSAIIPTHNPSAERLRRTLQALRRQTLARELWEIILVDNASTPAINLADLAPDCPLNIRLVAEAALGLTQARQRGFREAAASFAVLVDDDNVLASDYLDRVHRTFCENPSIGIFGGKSTPEFEVTPPAWSCEFQPLLALRDLGSNTIVSRGLRPEGAVRNSYPLFAPIGAGMAIRREAWTAWLDNSHRATPTDRRGTELTSGGDNDIVLAAMSAGWEVAYIPQLTLTHLIPAARLNPRYLARLNRGIQKSWMQVLARYEANPWPPLTPLGATARKLRAWFTYRGWRRPVGYIRWQGACGHFEGRIRPSGKT